MSSMLRPSSSLARGRFTRQARALLLFYVWVLATVVAAEAARRALLAGMAGDGGLGLRAFAGEWAKAAVRCGMALAVQTALRARRRPGEGLGMAAEPVVRMLCLAAASDAAVSTWYLAKHVGSSRTHVPFYLAYPLLIAKVFVWEVAFDFVHYWCHRLSHAHPLVYRLSHRTHHRGYRSQKTPTPLATYQQGALDLCVSNAIPAAFALAVVDATLGPVGAAAQEVLWAQKVFVEVAGHNGLDETTWTAFPVCVWLPRVLDIHIRSRDHHMHHKRPSCNFGKRTTLWDRAFGTLATV